MPHSVHRPPNPGPTRVRPVLRWTDRIGIVRRYPARFQLVLASPSCGCGADRPECSCTTSARRRFVSRLTGPLLDRIDLRVRLRPDAPLSRTAMPDSIAVLRERVREARHRAARRWAEHGWHTNAEVPGPVLRRAVALPRSTTAPLDRGLASGSLTARGADRCLRVAWTLADLAGRDQPGPDQIADALTYRDRRPV